MTLPFGFNDPEFQTDLYANYAHLRCNDPVHESFYDGDTRYHLLRFEDVWSAFRDERIAVARPPDRVHQNLLASGHEDLVNLGRTIPHIPILVNPPDHTRLRGLLVKAFTPRSVERLEPRVEALVAELLDPLSQRPGFDLIADFAVPLPVIVIAELLGVPAADRERLKVWSDDFTPILDRTLNAAFLPRTARATTEFSEYLRALVAERRREPRDDLLTALIQAREQDEALSEDELVANCLFLLVAGHETTTNLIGNGMLALLRHPDELRRLRAEPELTASAVEEVLRYDAPVQRVPRLTREELEIRGTRIPPRTVIDLVVGSANRDPARFAEPDRFDIGREDNRHVAFGGGIHFCLGAALARLEGRVALRALVDRFPSLKLASDAPTWRAGSLIHGLESLPLAL